MELYQLRHFVAVAETGSFTRGAERCHVTQPALSGSIARLEEDLGAKLFFRTKRSVSLTDAGQKLLTDSLLILKACNSAREKVRGSGQSRKLRLGVVRTFPTQKLTALLTALRVDLAGLEVQITEGSPTELDERLEMNKLDAALTILADGASHTNGLMPVMTERYLLFATSTHPLASKREVFLSDLTDQQFIVRTACETYATTTALLREKGVHTVVACRTQQDDRALELVRAGFGVALMPELFDAEGVKKIAISDFPASRTIGVKWAPDRKTELVDRLCVFVKTHPWQTH